MKTKPNPDAWVGIALDGVLAEMTAKTSDHHIGPPVPAVVDLVKLYLEAGTPVKIITPRVAQAMELNDCSASDAIKKSDEVYMMIVEWLEMHIGQTLPITAATDMNMIVLYSDRCIQVEQNTGVALVDYYKDAADTMNAMLEEIRGALGVANQNQIMDEIRRLVK